MAESTTLSQIMLKKAPRKILKYLMEHKEEQITITEIEDGTDCARTTITKFINSLRDLGLVKKKRHGMQYLIEVNTDSPYYSPLKRVLEIDTEPLRDLAKKVASELMYNYSSGIRSIYLFGSVAKGIPTTTSDIDLLVVLKDEKKDSTVQEADKRDFKEELQAYADGVIKDSGVTPSLKFYTEKRLKKDEKRKIKLIENIKEHGELLEGEDVL